MKEDSIKISVIVCTYNGASRLKFVMESLLDQNYDPSRFEILIIDNDSDDNTREICEEIIKSSSAKRIEYHFEKNRGLSYARNRGIKESKGQIVTFIDDDAILVIDGGDIEVYTIEQINFYKPRQPLSTLASICMGHLGTAVPYVIGSKLAKPNKQVVAIAGDGSFMMNIQDLETAVRLGLKNVIIVIANNSAWGMIRSCQNKYMGKRCIDVDLPEFDYAKAAEAFGCYGEVITNPNEIKPALERAKISNKVAVLDVKIVQTMPETTKLMASMGVL